MGSVNSTFQAGSAYQPNPASQLTKDASKPQNDKNTVDTLKQYFDQSGTKFSNNDDIKNLTQNPNINQNVRDAAQNFLGNDQLKDLVDTGDKNSKKGADGTYSSGDFAAISNKLNQSA